MESARPQIKIADEDAHHVTLLFAAMLLLISQSMRDTIGSKSVYWFLVSFIVVYYVSGDGLGRSKTEKFLGSLFFASVLMGLVILA